MGFLDNLTVRDIKQKPKFDPVERMRQNFVNAVQRQIELIGSEDAPGPRWWFNHSDGKLYTFLKYGNSKLIFDGGDAILVNGDLKKFYKEAIKATRRGELDEILDTARKRQPRVGVGNPGKRKRWLCCNFEVPIAGWVAI